MKLGPAEIQLINALDSIARVGARDCFVQDEGIVFLVPEKSMRQAIGKNGVTIQKIREKLGKHVEIFGYSEKPEKFLENAFFRAKIDEVEIRQSKEKKVAIIKADNANKKVMLQNMGRLKKIKELAKRNYDIAEIRIR